MVFLQSWRAALIPIIAIPVSLIGTFAVMALAFGFSLNNLSLFGLVLAIGIVVDDAIVVVENIERHLRAGMGPREAAHLTMDEVGGALVAIALVLAAVFVPTAFISGISGQFYKQFALTIASATLISLIVSLTLSPALAALIMKPHDHHRQPKGWERPFAAFANGFNRQFDRLSGGYSVLTHRLVRMAVLMLVLYVGLLLLTGWRLAATPTGFIPAQDQGQFLVAANLPAGATLERTDAIMQRGHQIACSPRRMWWPPRSTRASTPPPTPPPPTPARSISSSSRSRSAPPRDLSTARKVHRRPEASASAWPRSPAPTSASSSRRRCAASARPAASR